MSSQVAAATQKRISVTRECFDRLMWTILKPFPPEMLKLVYEYAKESCIFSIWATPGQPLKVWRWVLQDFDRCVFEPEIVATASVYSWYQGSRYKSTMATLGVDGSFLICLSDYWHEMGPGKLLHFNAANCTIRPVDLQVKPGSTFALQITASENDMMRFESSGERRFSVYLSTFFDSPGFTRSELILMELSLTSSGDICGDIIGENLLDSVLLPSHSIGSIHGCLVAGNPEHAPLNPPNVIYVPNSKTWLHLPRLPKLPGDEDESRLASMDKDHLVYFVKTTQDDLSEAIYAVEMRITPADIERMAECKAWSNVDWLRWNVVAQHAIPQFHRLRGISCLSSSSIAFFDKFLCSSASYKPPRSLLTYDVHSSSFSLCNPTLSSSSKRKRPRRRF